MGGNTSSVTLVRTGDEEDVEGLTWCPAISEPERSYLRWWTRTVFKLFIGYLLTYLPVLLVNKDIATNPNAIYGTIAEDIISRLRNCNGITERIVKTEHVLWKKGTRENMNGESNPHLTVSLSQRNSPLIHTSSVYLWRAIDTKNIIFRSLSSLGESKDISIISLILCKRCLWYVAQQPKHFLVFQNSYSI